MWYWYISVWVSYPLKQGLKQKDEAYRCEKDEGLSQLSIKTRIETSFVIWAVPMVIALFESAIH